MFGNDHPQGAADDDEIHEWMRRRKRDVERLGGEAETLGHYIWAAATRTGQNVPAPRPSDVKSLGAKMSQSAPALHSTSPVRQLGANAPNIPVLGISRSPAREMSADTPKSFGALGAPPTGDMSELRRKQAEFTKIRRDLDIQNSWLAAPIFAATAITLGLSGAAALGARGAASVPRPAPLSFPKPQSLRRGGETLQARAGRRAHRELDTRVDLKPDWTSNPRLTTAKGETRIPDVGLPKRPGRVDKFLELKPNTPSGKRAATQAVKKYNEFGKTRPIYYDPKDYL